MISVCMIVKNEIAVLERCINSVRDKMGSIVNEYVVVDTGSNDGTRELAQKLNCNVYDFEWCDDFSKARNFNLSKATNDWVFVIDADEYVVSDINTSKLKNLLNREYMQYLFMVNVQNFGDSGFIEGSGEVCRLFNRKKYQYKNIIHEQLYNISNKEMKKISTTIILNHTGYTEEAKKSKNKTEVYKNMLLKHLKTNPNDIYIKGHLGKIYLTEGNYEKAMKFLEDIVFNEQAVYQESYSTMVCSYLSCLINLEKNEAVIIFENVWEHCKQDDKYLFYMADAYLKTKRYEKAVDTYLYIVNKESVSNMDKKYSYYMLGGIFEVFNDLQQALKCFETCGDFYDAESRAKEIKEKM